MSAGRSRKRRLERIGVVRRASARRGFLGEDIADKIFASAVLPDGSYVVVSRECATSFGGKAKFY